MSDALTKLATEWFAADVVRTCGLLLLAALRWCGFLWAAPLPGRNAVPMRTRFCLALLMAVLVLPALSGPAGESTRAGVAGTKQVDEALVPLVSRLSGEQTVDVPSLLTLGVLAASEFVLGLVLGFGMRIVLSGILLAGELIDQQAGIALAEIFNPALQQRTTPTGDWLVWTAVAVFLAAPLNGDLRAAALMLDLFDVLPVAGLADVGTAQNIAVAIVQQSVVLALQLALPLLAVMSLISLATAWAGRAGRPMALWPGMIPLRIAVSLLLLAVGVGSSAELLVARFSGWIDGARALLLG